MSNMTFQGTPISIGSEVLFGHYPQRTDGAVLPIVWDVLETSGGRALLLSHCVLDSKPYHDIPIAAYWKNVSLRAWLNREFLNNAFTTEEKRRIQPSAPEEDPEWETRWKLTAKDTPTDMLTDHVFLLSSDDMKQYFPDAEDPRAAALPTAYAAVKRSQGVSQGDSARWWLRSAASGMPLAFCASGAESISICGVSGQLGVRPALWVLLDGAVYQQCAEKKVEEDYVPAYHSGLAPVGESTSRLLSSFLQLQKGDIVSLGTYPQGKRGEVYPIDWVVLKTDGHWAMLLSRYILDVQRFSARPGDPYWPHSYIRDWLDQSFAKQAFTEEDWRLIRRHELPEYPSYAYDEWKEDGFEMPSDFLCEDVFLLSREDIIRCFPGYNEMFCPGAKTQITPWAYETYARKTAMDQLSWWLRSASNRNDFVYIVSPQDSIGFTVRPYETLQGVRPAVIVRIPYPYEREARG